MQNWAESTMSTEDMLFDDGPATQAARPKTTSVAGENQMNKHSIRPVRTLNALTPSRSHNGYFTQFIEDVEIRRAPDDLILDKENQSIFDGLVREVRQGDQLRRHAITPRNKVLFCGPPGCGKTLAAEVFAIKAGLPFKALRIDALISSFLGETASNLRKAFEEVARRPAVMFLDEFDSIAHTRRDQAEHSEMRRVVNTLLVLIENYSGTGVMIAATNLQDRIDKALWRRFDEVLFFDLPNDADIKSMLKLKTRNFPAMFDISRKSARFKGMSFADIERVCAGAIKLSILDGERRVAEKVFDAAIQDERRRQRSRLRLERRFAK